MNWVIIIFIFVLGIVFGILATKRGGQSFGSAQGKVKEENLKKVLDLFTGRKEITNDDVQKFLGVSDATATRYLEELERSGKIRQIGLTGRSVTYELL